MWFMFEGGDLRRKPSLRPVWSMGGFQRCSGEDPSADGYAQPAGRLLAGGGFVADDLAAAPAAEHDESGGAPVGPGRGTFAALLL